MQRLVTAMLLIVLAMILAGPTGSLASSPISGSAYTKAEASDLYMLTMTSSFDVVHTGSDGETSTYRMSAESNVFLAPPTDGSAGVLHQGSGSVRQIFWDGQNIGTSIACPAPADIGSMNVKGQIGEAAISNLRIMPSIMPTMWCTAIGEGSVPVAMPVLWYTCMYAMHEDEMDAQARAEGLFIQGWQMSAQGDVLASKSYARQKSFPAGGGSNLCTENTQLQILRLPNLPYVGPIRAMGIGTHENRPETGSEVRMCAEIDDSSIYELERCYWSGDLEAGEGDPDEGCLHFYTPSMGHGPSRDTYGLKDVTLSLTYRHVDSGARVYQDVTSQYEVFFDKYGYDERTDAVPNWFTYWADDGAVVGLDAENVVYDPVGEGYGAYSATQDVIKIRDSAAGVHYRRPIVIEPDYVLCSIGQTYTFGQEEGIDATQIVLEHELRHKQHQDNWESPNTGTCGSYFGPWGGCANSDGDLLPDEYERVLGTYEYWEDSCDLASKKKQTYAEYGDEELDCMITADGYLGVSANDWANPGKQADLVTVLPCPPTMHGASTRTERPSPHVPSETVNNVDALAHGVRFTGQYGDAALDQDHDGCDEALAITMGVESDMAADVTAVIWLEDAQGAEVAWAQSGVSLITGTQTISVAVAGPDLWPAGIDGPYRLVGVALMAGDHDTVIAQEDDAHTTQAYVASQFCAPAATLAGGYADVTPAPAQDGCRAELVIRVDLDVRVAGQYALYGELVAGEESVATASRSIALASGRQAMPLLFSGTEIASSRLDGPYALENVSLRDVTGLRLDHAATPYTTTIPYGHQEFLCGEGFLDVSRASDQAVDLDQDGFFDQLDITVYVVARDYVGMRVLGTLADAEGCAIAQAVVHPVEIMRDDPWTLTADGTRVLTGTLSFAGSAIASHGVDGPFVLDPLTLAGGDGTLYDAVHGAHVTGAYAASAFDAERTPEPATEEVHLPLIWR